MYALTSLSPDEASTHRQQACLQSWRQAGLHVVSFNHPREIESLAGRYDVALVPVESTSEPVFGRPFIPVRSMVDWAERRNVPILIVNSDIDLQLSPWQMKRLRWIADDGLCYLVRHNYDGDLRRAAREPYGIDAFLFHGRYGPLISESFLSMGQPFWDYWLPYAFASAGRPIWAVEFPAALHRNHPRRWSDASWHRCALEFDRLTGLLGPDRSLEACYAMSWQVRQAFESQRSLVPPRPVEIRDWVRGRFGGGQPKTFLELGAHTGTDTDWMAALPNVTLHAFEPDPRNQQPPRANVVMNRTAVADRDGRSPFLLSREGWGREWTYSSSIKQPKNHLQHYPVTFGETIEVETVTLDTYCRKRGLDVIDFIWADIQGAEGEMIRGGRETLARTRYLFTEYSDHELYEGQVTLEQILAELPGFRVVELYEEDVLLENQSFAAGDSPLPHRAYRTNNS